MESYVKEIFLNINHPKGEPMLTLKSNFLLESLEPGYLSITWVLQKDSGSRKKARESRTADPLSPSLLFFSNKTLCKPTHNDWNTSLRKWGENTAQCVVQRFIFWHILSFGKWQFSSVKHKDKTIFSECRVLREELLFEITNGHGIRIFKACVCTHGSLGPGSFLLPGVPESACLATVRQAGAGAERGEDAGALTPAAPLHSSPRREHFCFC